LLVRSKATLLARLLLSHCHTLHSVGLRLIRTPGARIASSAVAAHDGRRAAGENLHRNLTMTERDKRIQKWAIIALSIVEAVIMAVAFIARV
jgi:metal-dependent hydrolase (beta-lactamase superfamily II)